MVFIVRLQYANMLNNHAGILALVDCVALNVIRLVETLEMQIQQQQSHNSNDRIMRVSRALGQ